MGDVSMVLVFDWLLSCTTDVFATFAPVAIKKSGLTQPVPEADAGIMMLVCAPNVTLA
jgi:hypothetical protein